MSGENRSTPFEVIEIAGHRVVAPMLDSHIGEKLCRPLKEYFPNGDPDLWFGWTDEEQNRWVVERMFAGRCAFLGIPNPGEYVGCHHIIQKSVAPKLANVPWNCVPVMHSPNRNRNIHGALHPDSGLGLEIRHWDQFDAENGLAVLDRRDGGHRIPNEELEFSRMPSRDKSNEATAWIRQVLAVYRAFSTAAYQLGALAAVGKEHAVVLGHKTVNSCMSGYGMDTEPFKLGARVADAFTAWWETAMKNHIPLRVMDMIRKAPEDKRQALLKSALERCAPLDLDDTDDMRRNPSLPDWLEEKNKAMPTGVAKPVECTLFDADVKYVEAELTAAEIQKTPQLVIAGLPVKKKA